jgi:hypothetical protein
MILFPQTRYSHKFLSNKKGSGHQAGATPFFSKNNSINLSIFLLFILLASPIFPTQSAKANQTNPYLHSLLVKASKLKLDEHRFWHLILHYKSNIFGGWISEVDDPRFFLAPNGKHNPRAELEATIKAFFLKNPREDSQQSPQCSFIARFHWLKKELEFDTTQLPQVECQRFESWLNEINPNGLSLIFPSAYLNNPASVFGHSFLRIDRKGQTEQTRILAYTINYAADVPPDAGLEFAYKGIFGGYRGYFMTPPYYLKVKEYRDIENRDIWEYRLNFSEEQILRLLQHVWELGNVYFDYFFFKENCAYHILSLLEVADPRLHLTDHFHLATIPADTIRLLMRQQGLIDDVVYRPARSTQLKRKRETLSSQESAFLDRLHKAPSFSEDPEFLQLPQSRQTFLLDLTSDFLRYKSLTKQDLADQFQQTNRSILLRRSQIPIPSEPFPVEPYSLSPDHGHETTRTGVGFGWRNSELFEEINFRAAYHDLLDPDPGYTQDAQIELLELGLRHYHGRNQFRIERFTFANILSLAPMDSWFFSPSWKIRAGMNTVRFRECDLCSNGNFNAGAGAAFETHMVQREVFFLFGEFDANVSGVYDGNHRVGGGVSGGLMATITENWKWLISGGYLYYPLGDRSDDFNLSIGQRVTLAKNLALRTTFTHHDRDNELVLVLHGYF